MQVSLLEVMKQYRKWIALALSDAHIRETQLRRVICFVD